MVDGGAEAVEMRLRRLSECVALAGPDRIAVIPIDCHYFPAKWSGMSFKEAMHDHQRYFDALKAVVLEFDFDMAPTSSIFPAQPWEALGLKHWKWPGHGLPDDRVFQYTETEIMRADEYDELLSDPDGFTLRRLWPRIAARLEPLSDLPPLVDYFNNPQLLGAYASLPPFADMLRTLLKLGEESAVHGGIQTRCFDELEELGYPRTSASAVVAPFDTVSVWLRGLRGSMLDMYRHPDRLLAAIDLFTRMQIRSGVLQAASSGNPRVSVYAFRGAAGFMSEEQFERFYWPSFHELVDSLVHRQLMPILFLQGDFTPRLPHLSELPKGKMPIHFDRVDRLQAQKALRDHSCFWGNIPVSLMEHGTPQQIVDDVKELIDLFGAGGGLIIDSSAGLSDDARPENVSAMVNTVKTYGQS